MTGFMPTATDVIEEANRFAERLTDAFRKPGLDEDDKAIEDKVLISIAFMYHPRPGGSRYWDHTVSASLVDSLDAAPYMDYPQAVLTKVREQAFFLKKCSEVWRRSPSQWALSWSDESKDDE
jgi:hypothetical protein